MKNLQRVPDLPLEPACDAAPKPGLSLVPAPPLRPAPLLWVMYLAYFAFGLTGVVGTLTPDIITEFHLTRAAAGLMGTSTFLSVALFAMPSGVLADRLGARRVILAGVALMALGCFMVFQSHTYAMVLAMIFAIGTGVTMLQTSGSPMIQRLDAPQNYHRNLTFAVACCTFAAFLAIFCLAYLRGTGHRWQAYYLLFGFVCLAVVGLLAISKFPARATNAEGIHLEQIGKLLRNPILLTYGLGILCLSGCFSKPQAVVYRRAAPSISENLARVPIDVRERRGLPEISGSVPLAGGFCLSAMREPEFLRNRESPALAMHSLSVSSLPDGRDDSA